jgi:xanthine/uracil/vitamin C permease (AzgA family)
MSAIDNVKLSRADKPQRKFIENPFTWWEGTPLWWNTNVTIWNGSGEAEALCELFFDNLATLLGVTGAAVGYIGYGIIGNSFSDAPGYGMAMAAEWEKVYFNKCIPGCAFGLLFGNAYYAWQAGRLGAKEKRNDVTAQPYGMNTTGIYITLFAVTLTALFIGGSKYMDEALGTATMSTQNGCKVEGNAAVMTESQVKTFAAGDVEGAAKKAVDYAWKVSVAANFCMGLFEMLGAFIGEAIRKITPTAAFYSPLVGVGFVWLAFSPMLSIAKEPMMCLIPLLVIFSGFFGGVRYKIVGKLTVPIAFLAIAIATIAGWSGACKKTNVGAQMYGYTRPFGEEADYVTCTGTSSTALEDSWEKYAFSSDMLKDSVFVGLGGFGDIGDMITTIFLVACVGFTATMACVESASAAGDDYPMAETLLVDGAGTCIAALFGGIYSTTVYIGHPIHKALGARRGYSLVNGLIYFALLLSGVFSSLYEMIPECANGAILVFVGLLLGRQAFEETKPSHYPALLLSTFPFICNWAKLGNIDEGVQTMGQAGGLIFSFVLTWVFCLCIDRKFDQAAALSFVNIWLSMVGIFASHNHANEDGTLGNEKIGWYPKEDHDYNQGWRWAISWSLACVFFLIQFGLQKIEYIDKPVDDAPLADAAATPKKEEAPEANEAPAAPVEEETTL